MGLAPLFEIREEHSFATAVQHLGGYEQVDLATENLYWKLARDPIGQSFPVTGMRARITFTEEAADLPVMRVVLRIDIERRLVSLLWIEEADDAPPMGFDDYLSIV